MPPECDVGALAEDLIRSGTSPRDILFIRFDLELLREEAAALRSALRWFEQEVRRRPLRRGRPAYVFLDEVHKLRRWHEEVKHIGDTYPLRMLLVVVTRDLSRWDPAERIHYIPLQNFLLAL